MKTRILILTLMLALPGLGYSNEGNAQEQNANTNSNTIVTYTSEKTFGADCICVKEVKDQPGIYEPAEDERQCTEKVYQRKYQCTSTKGLSGFMAMFRQIVQWIINVSIILGVLAIAALGIAWAVAGGDNPEYKKQLKDWVISLIIGLTIIFMFRYILGFLAPWIFK